MKKYRSLFQESQPLSHGSLWVVTLFLISWIGLGSSVGQSLSDPMTDYRKERKILDSLYQSNPNISREAVRNFMKDYHREQEEKRNKAFKKEKQQLLDSLRQSKPNISQDQLQQFERKLERKQFEKEYGAEPDRQENRPASQPQSLQIPPVAPAPGFPKAPDYRTLVAEQPTESDSTYIQKETKLSEAVFQGAVPDAVERAALVALYNATGGSSWDDNTNWLNGTSHTDFATWKGVTVINGDVFWLRLSRNNLSGSIPDELGNLTSLDEFVCTTCDLSGGIPSTFQNLSNLRELHLNNNNLSGSIPAFLGDLSNLELLILDINNFTGNIPSRLGNLSNLRFLNINDNNFSGSIPSELGSLSSLNFLNISNAGLSGSIPPELGNLAELRRLYLQNNSLSGSIPAELGKLNKNYTFDLSYNNLSGNIPASLGNLKEGGSGSSRFFSLSNNKRLRFEVRHKVSVLQEERSMPE